MMIEARDIILSDFGEREGETGRHECAQARVGEGHGSGELRGISGRGATAIGKLCERSIERTSRCTLYLQLDLSGRNGLCRKLSFREVLSSSSQTLTWQAGEFRSTSPAASGLARSVPARNALRTSSIFLAVSNE